MNSSIEPIVIYIDLDDTIFKYREHFYNMREKNPKQPYPQSVVHFFYDLPPIENAVKVIKWMFTIKNFEIYFLTAPSVENPLCYTEKRLSLDKHLGKEIGSRMIISINKGLNIGDYLIDDCTEGKGQDKFKGEIIQFGTKKFPNWNIVKSYFEKLAII
jgi:5'-nucleotidase